MQLLNLLFGGLLASKAAPVIERLGVTTYITKYVTNTVTVTKTSTATVGILATPVVHSVPAFSLASSRSPLDPYQPTAPVNHGISSNSASVLFSFTKWGSTPLNITPFQVIGYSFALYLLATFFVFWELRIHREWVAQIAEHWIKAFKGHSMLIWTIVFFFVYSLAHGYNHIDPANVFCHQLHAIAAIYPETVPTFLLRISDFWYSHRHTIGNFWLAAWLKVLRPTLTKICLQWLNAAERRVHQLPELNEKLMGYISQFINLSITGLCTAYIFIAWLVEKVSSPFLFGGYICYGVYLRLYPAHHIAQLKLSQKDKANLWVQSEYRHVANMPVEERSALLHEVKRCKKELKDFNRDFVQPLGVHCQNYRKTIHLLIEDNNCLRATLDAVANYERSNDLGHNGLITMSTKLYKSAKIRFEPQKTKWGYHCSFDEHSARCGIWRAYNSLSLEHIENLRYGPNDVVRAHRKGQKVSSLAMKRFTYQQHEAWGLEARMPGVQFPPYSNRVDNHVMEKHTNGNLQALSFPEDVAAYGLALKNRDMCSVQPSSSICVK